MPEGSWLITSLVDNINTYAKDEDFLTILTKSFSDINKKALEHNKKFVFKQVPCLVSTLIKKFYLYQEDQQIETNRNSDSSENGNEDFDFEMNGNEETIQNRQRDSLEMNENHSIQKNQRNAGARLSEVEITQVDNTKEKIAEVEDVTSFDAIVSDEEIMSRCTLTTLLLPTILLFLLICAILYMFIYQEGVNDLFGDFLSLI